MALSETEEQWLEGLLTEVDGARLSPWETGFVADQRKSFEEFGSAMHLSGRQWGVLKRVANKIGYDQPGSGDDE